MGKFLPVAVPCSLKNLLGQLWSQLGYKIWSLEKAVQRRGSFAHITPVLSSQTWPCGPATISRSRTHAHWGTSHP